MPCGMVVSSVRPSAARVDYLLLLPYHRVAKAHNALIWMNTLVTF